MLAQKLLSSLSGAAAETLYVDDVFSTYLYTGNGSTQTITNGIDLAGKGGLVWVKARNGAGIEHALYDTNRGLNSYLDSASSGAQINYVFLTGFNSNGFGVTTTSGSNTNNSSYNYASWTFRKAPKFFDCGTYTGNGSSLAVMHALGVTPGMVIIKRTNSTSDWVVYHNGIASNQKLLLNSTGSALTQQVLGSITSSSFNVLNNGTEVQSPNVDTAQYVWYAFAHDPSADGIVQCGSYTGTASAFSVELGWEPQYLLVKSSSSSSYHWQVIDMMRGFTNQNAAGNSLALAPNGSFAESSFSSQLAFYPTATGFAAYPNTASNLAATGQTYIYLAIRRPNKPPTTGTQVYKTSSPNESGSFPCVQTGWPVDMGIVRTNKTTTGGNFIASRLAGERFMYTDSTAAEVADTSFKWDSNNGWLNLAGANLVAHSFRRAPGVFDQVCYTGTGSATTVAHSLGVAPELMIVKRRDLTGTWRVLHTYGPSLLALNLTNAGNFTDAAIGGYFGNGSTYVGYQPTSSVFSVSNATDVNSTSATYTAYLFATKAGISKVGSYTGNGGTQTIDCGFTTGCRFALIKRTDSTGDWLVWDTARGIVAGNDPHLSLNTTVAEVTTNDSIDPVSSGFAVNQLAATNINVNAATYIYLAFA